MKIALSGGHFSPALALIEKLPKDVSLFVIGRKYAHEGDTALSYEYRVCEKEKIPFYSIRAGRLQRRLTRFTIPSFLSSPVGVLDALKILRTEKPDVVLSFGGYLSLAITVAARTLGIPVVIHEQTQAAGIANKIIAKFAKKICISFESSYELFPRGKTVLTGNPVRSEIFSIQKKISVVKGFPVLYITGGSSGSHFINSQALQTLDALLENFVVIHQTGDTQVFKDFEKLSEAKSNLDKQKQSRYILKKFIFRDEIGSVFDKADLVVSRCGINTVCEILALSKMCFLIPLPHGQVGEQIQNAKLVKKIGIGEYIEQDSVTPEVFLREIRSMIENKKTYLENALSAKRIVIPDAAEKILDAVQLVYEDKYAKKELTG